MNNLKAAVFITKQLPLLWTGGTGAVAQVKNALEARGAEVVETEIVVWSEKKRDTSRTLRVSLECYNRYFPPLKICMPKKSIHSWGNTATPDRC